MKTARLLIALLWAPLFLAAQPAAPAAAPSAEADQQLAQFDAEWKAVWKTPHPELSPLQHAQLVEQGSLRLREIALGFLEKFPRDPRRWVLVSHLYPGLPRFVTEWGPLDDNGLPSHPKFDQAAVAAWKAQVTALRTEMFTAPDLPAEVRQELDKQQKMRDESRSKTEAFLAEARTGQPAPDFTMRDLGGAEVNLAQFRGQVVVLDFWATWCGPCKAAMPHTQETAAKYKDQGVVVIGSCTNDTRANFERWVKANAANYPDIRWAADPAERNPERASSKLFHVSGIPTQFIINREGRIVDAVVGYLPGEVLLDAALARAGVRVDPALVAQAERDWRKRQQLQ